MEPTECLPRRAQRMETSNPPPPALLMWCRPAACSIRFATSQSLVQCSAFVHAKDGRMLFHLPNSDVTLRLIANRVLSKGQDETYVQGEIVSKEILLPQLPADKRYHVFCSAHNVGAAELLAEVADKGGFALDFEREHVRPRLSRTVVRQPRKSKSSSLSTANWLRATEKSEDILSCDSLLIYLTRHTWTSKDSSSTFAKEVNTVEDCVRCPTMGNEVKRNASAWACLDRD